MSSSTLLRTPTTEKFQEPELKIPHATPRKGPTRADDEDQTRVRDVLGKYNNEDMFLQEMDDFLGSYAPCTVAPEVLKLCLGKLAKDLLVSPTPKTNAGRFFLDGVTPPKDIKIDDKRVHEDHSFKFLKPIFDTILKMKRPDSSLQFELCPRTYLDSDIPGGNHLIDGCFVDEPIVGGKLSHRTIRIPVELKKARDPKDRDMVHRQILAACHHILNEDPRRMWIYGLTFENTMVSVWYFSRSHSVKTFAFDYFDKPEVLVELILSFALATPAQLGIDPYVHIGPTSDDGNTLSYVYEIPSTVTGGAPVFYRTGPSLFPERPMCIAGRVTRIWEVTQVRSADGTRVVKHGRTAILKDVWLDEGTETEAENMDKIFEAIDSLVEDGLRAQIDEELKNNPNFDHNPVAMARLMRQFIDQDAKFKSFDDVMKDRLQHHLTNKNYKSLFLKKLYAWKGELSKPRANNVQHHPTLFSIKPVTKNAQSEASRDFGKTKDFLEPKSNRSGSHYSIPEGDSSMVAMRRNQPSRRFVRKQQSRFVYQEVCTPLFRLSIMGEAIDVIVQTLEALQLLYSVGWVHRDISASNILAFRTGDEWNVKLADLEFSRVMVDSKRKVRTDPRTGTPFFMPTEILARKYLIHSYNATDLKKSRVVNIGPAVPAFAIPDLPSDSGPVKKTPQNLAEQLGFLEHEEPYAILQTIKKLPIEITKEAIPPNVDWSKIPTHLAIVNHSYQHDLESIWWIILWLIAMRAHVESLDDATPEITELFTHNIHNFRPRQVFFTQPADVDLGHHLRSEFSPFPAFMEGLREHMYQAYIRRAAFGQLDLQESYSNIIAVFALYFRSLQNNDGPWRQVAIDGSKKPQVMRLPLPDDNDTPQSAAGSKRGHDGAMSTDASKRLRLSTQPSASSTQDTAEGPSL
ncbi:hypothetical protein D9619_005414 [Psilocybe cf. subviscida]|uniref:Protein kinase domain-containing protein n=1 Tax=Psilocybe cf. subviscida TaxID=2480587 RepID=A0A8H5BWP9_9AGAR|nr:hypothetical protein D9619_005414 [Psilocybe cf. subviscida]